MASDEDARAAARRIVEQVLADRAGTDVLEPAEREAPADEVTSAPEPDAIEVEVEDDPRLEVLVDDAVEDLVADPAADVPEDVSEARARARALVAEVLADHEARTAEAARAADPEPAPAVEVAPTDDEEAPEVVPAAEVDPTDDEDDEPTDDEPDVGRTVEDSPESTSRLRARELVAAVLAEAEAREAAAAAAAAAEEAEAEAVRRAEADAAAAQAREAEAARELAAALAEETERELWADADRDAASRTQPLQREGEGGGAQPSGEAGSEPDETRPLSVAELAAAERSARGTEGQAEPDGSAERTAVISVVAGATVASRGDVDTTAQAPNLDDGPVPALTEAGAAPASEDAPPPAEEGTAVTGVLEATVDPAEVGDPPRTGRWLLASILGAVTLAILFPMAIRALLDLVALS